MIGDPDTALARVHADTPVGAEIGVSIGQMSECLLSMNKGMTLYMVDSWVPESEL